MLPGLIAQPAKIAGLVAYQVTSRGHVTLMTLAEFHKRAGARTKSGQAKPKPRTTPP